ncbi:MAG: type II secretion system protein [Thermoguttaceae bacterium]
MSRTKRSVVRGQWSVARDQSVALKGGAAARRPAPSRRGFTLTEMLVTIAIIAILASLAFGGLQIARNSARESATKATIAKLNNIIMARYESYLTRRIPLSLQGLGPSDAARVRLDAIRDLMRMEMPDRGEDVSDNPIQITAGGKTFQLQRPALSQRYQDRLDNADQSAGTGVSNGQAEFLFMIVSMGSPEAMEQFSPSEIGDTNKNGFPEFLDGWGRPIFFLRWAPGFSSGLGSPMPSDIQTGNPTTDHDPFDPRHVESDAFHLIPLIYSGGPSSDPGLKVGDGYHFGDTANPGSMFSGSNRDAFLSIGTQVKASAKANITNHSIEQR